MDISRVLDVQVKPGWLTPGLGRSTRVASRIVLVARLVGAPALQLIYTTDHQSGELLYQIQGTNAWLTEKDFNDRCQANTR